jgi:hypothetical protein
MLGSMREHVIFMEKNMDMVNYLVISVLIWEKYMKGNFIMANNMDMGFYMINKEINLKEHLRMIRDRVLDNSLLNQVMFSLEIL